MTGFHLRFRRDNGEKAAARHWLKRIIPVRNSTRWKKQQYAKKNLICLLLGFSLLTTGCDQSKKETGESPPGYTLGEAKEVGINGKIRVVVIDGCEYIIYQEKGKQNDGYGFMAHKGNCKNPIHRNRQLVTERQNKAIEEE